MGISPAIIAAGVGAAGSIGGAALSSSAAGSAAQTQANSANQASLIEQQMANQANQLQLGEFGTEAQLLNPNRQAGNYAQQALESALGLPTTPLSNVNLPTIDASGNVSTTGGSSGAGGGSGITASSPFFTIQNGQISPNSALMSDPAYAAAWNQVVAQNQKTGGANWNVLNQDPNLAAQNNTNLQNLSGEIQSALGPTASQAILNNPQYNPNTLQGTSALTSGQTSQFANLFQPFSYSAAQYQQSPGYQFTLQQGLNQIQNNAAAAGMSLSPNTIKDLQSYASGLANQDYQQAYTNAYNAYTQNQANTINSLSGLAGYGNTATSQIASGAANTGSNVANTLTSTGQAIGSNTIGAGNALAAGTVGSANALSGGLNNLSSTYLQSQLLSGLTGSGGSSGYNFYMPSSSSGSGVQYGLGSGLNYNFN